MANRLTRDQLLVRSLNLVDSPRLNEIDRPSGTIVSTALSLGWLQDGLDLAHNLFPEAGALKSVTFNVTAGTSAYPISGIATDFVQDFKNGILLPDNQGRLYRKSLNKLLDLAIGSTARQKPQWYALHNKSIVLRPEPDKAYAATTLYYYSLPTALTANEVPNFPSDLVLVEYVHLRGREWIREIPAGTAEAYLISAVARLQKSGLGSEAEIDDVIEVDRNVFPGGGTSYGGDADWFVKVNA